MWDAIVIESGVGGLAAAAALARRNRRVLVLEQHSVAGGLTQTFRRHDLNFAPGVHYIGGVSPLVAIAFSHGLGRYQVLANGKFGAGQRGPAPR